MRNQNLFLKKITALSTALMILVAFSFTRVEAAATPDLTPQQIEVVLEDAFAGLVAFDAERVVNHFAADAVFGWHSADGRNTSHQGTWKHSQLSSIR